MRISDWSSDVCSSDLAAHLQDAHLSHEGNRMSLPQPALYDGVIEPTADGGVLRFERRLAYPVDEVWDAVTNPGRLADWWLPFGSEERREGNGWVSTCRSRWTPGP